MGKKDGKKKDEPPKDQFDGLALDVKNVRTAVLNLSSQEEEVLSRCCHSCFNFAIKAPENCLELMELGAVEYLRILISHPDKLVRRHAGMALGIMSSVPKVRDHLAKEKHQLIQDCTQLIQDEDNIVAEFAVNILANISLVYQLKEDIVNCGALPFLVKLLTSNDPDIKKHAITTLLSLANDFEIRNQLADYDTVHVALGLLTSEYPTIQQLALKLATLMCHEASSREQVTDSDDLNSLVLFVENSNFADLHPDALHCLCQCFTDNDVLTQFKANGNLTRLVDAVKGNIETQLGEETSICFAELICRLGSSNPQNSDCLRLFVDSGVVDIISKMINQSDDAKIAAGHAIRVLAAEPSFRDQTADGGVTMKLVSLLTVDDEKVRREVVLSLAQLIQNHATNKGIMLANKGISTIVSLLGETDHDLLCGALSILIFMSTEEQAHTEAIESGLIPSLNMAIELNDSTELQQRVLQTITHYVTDSDTRNKLLDTSILSKIISLLESRDRKVRLGACSATVNLCQDTLMAQKMVDLGALTTLQKVNASTHLRSQSSEATFTQLLDYNLPAKLSLIGKLTQSNHIHDGFYDAGNVGYNSKFKPISELSDVEIDDKRPVLLIRYEDDTKDDVTTHSTDETASTKKTEKDSAKTSAGKGKKSSKKQKEKKEELKIPDPVEKKTSAMEMHHISASQQSMCDSTCQLPDDNQLDENLINIIQNAKSNILPTDDYQTHVRLLAELVVDNLGGAICKNRISESGYELEIVEIKRARNSNIIPIGHIKKGLYRERALLFKLLADICGVPATLEQGNYGRAWNCVIINKKETVIDLMGNPGEFYPIGTQQSSDYLSL